MSPSRRPTARQAIAKQSAERGKCIDHVRQELGVSVGRACRALGQHWSTQRKIPQGRADEQRLTDDIIELADQSGRSGYRMLTGLLNTAGWHVSDKRVERRGLVRHWSEDNGRVAT